MSKVIVLSDTHQNQLLLRTALQREVSESEYIFHLGDNYEDLDDNQDLLTGKEIVRVPGIFHPGYLAGTIPAVQIVTVLNWSFFLVHNLDDIPQIRPKHDVFLFGHSHQMSFFESDGRYYLNPGHLKKEWDKNRPASYVVMDVRIDGIDIEFKDKDGAFLDKKNIDRYR